MAGITRAHTMAVVCLAVLVSDCAVGPGASVNYASSTSMRIRLLIRPFDS
jgi:hypothetical protein